MDRQEFRKQMLSDRQYLVNIPHRFYKVSEVGDMYAPKNATQQVDKRYQSVRIVAAYDAAQLTGS